MNSPIPVPTPSPCVSVCRMDDATGLCDGCLRTLDEIACWSLLDDEERQAVCDELAVRRAAAVLAAYKPPEATR